MSTDLSFRYRRRVLNAYRALARKAAKVWREHGALEYRECVAEDVKVGKWTSFPRSVKLKPGETVVFSWITYKSRAHRDTVKAKVMKDPRLADMMDPKDDAVRRQAHDLWRLRGVRQRVIDTDAKEESNDRTWSLSPGLNSSPATRKDSRHSTPERSDGPMRHRPNRMANAGWR